MEQKTVKYGNYSFNATECLKKGKDKFVSMYLKKFDKREIFASRNKEQRVEFLNKIWELIEIECGVNKSPKKEAVTSKQADDKK